MSSVSQEIVEGVRREGDIPANYRSFFYLGARWQILGFRLAKDGS